jgi:hypothetical protein
MNCGYFLVGLSTNVTTPIWFEQEGYLSLIGRMMWIMPMQITLFLFIFVFLHDSWGLGFCCRCGGYELNTKDNV